MEPLQQLRQELAIVLYKANERKKKEAGFGRKYILTGRIHAYEQVMTAIQRLPNAPIESDKLIQQLITRRDYVNRQLESINNYQYEGSHDYQITGLQLQGESNALVNELEFLDGIFNALNNE